MQALPHVRLLAAATAVGLGIGGPALAQQATLQLDPIQVIGITPTHGTGIDRERWSVYAGVGGQRTSTDQPGYRQRESSLEGYASLWVRPERLPGLFTTLTLSRYRAVYGDSAEPLRTRGFGLRAGLDLAEHLLPAELGFLPQLRASYGAIWSSSRGPDARGVELDHGPRAELAIDF